MGLDMYLTGKKYLYTDADMLLAKNLQKELNTPFQVKEISCDFMYWRKANAIHAWFVKNCQDNIDECQETYITETSLLNLLNVCQEVLKSKTDEVSARLLPTQSGFFFGSTDYNDYYYEDVADTIEGLEKVLNFIGDSTSWSIYYRSSW